MDHEYIQSHNSSISLHDYLCVGFLFQEKALVNRYAETSAENTQRLNQMSLAKNLIALVREHKISLRT